MARQKRRSRRKGQASEPQQVTSTVSEGGDQMMPRTIRRRRRRPAPPMTPRVRLIYSVIAGVVTAASVWLYSSSVAQQMPGPLVIAIAGLCYWLYFVGTLYFPKVSKAFSQGTVLGRNIFGRALVLLILLAGPIALGYGVWEIISRLS
ncbi:MAG: hypothetical protein HYX89_00900 [Chloroflexi bacterium]|nr:hypothetical protein [Chloroflexota bacterium]